MQKIFLFLFLICADVTHSFSQDYDSLILAHREAYKADFLKEPKSPLAKSDLINLRFFAPNPEYKVNASFERINDTTGFDMQTYSGVIKKYEVYGALSFNLKGSSYVLMVYQSKNLKQKEGFEDYLFIPFFDKTNYKETYGGGRYLDIRMGDIKDGMVVIDFNKAYNPYCAYKGGYACPIPPMENKLKIAVRAGEMNYAGPKHD